MPRVVATFVIFNSVGFMHGANFYRGFGAVAMALAPAFFFLFWAGNTWRSERFLQMVLLSYYDVSLYRVSFIPVRDWCPRYREDRPRVPDNCHLYPALSCRTAGPVVQRQNRSCLQKRRIMATLGPDDHEARTPVAAAPNCKLRQIPLGKLSEFQSLRLLLPGALQ